MKDLRKALLIDGPMAGKESLIRSSQTRLVPYNHEMEGYYEIKDGVAPIKGGVTMVWVPYETE